MPERLSYPEILCLGRIKGAERFFYDGTTRDLAAKLMQLAACVEQDALWSATVSPAMLTDRFRWMNLAHRYDEALEQIRQADG